MRRDLQDSCLQCAGGPEGLLASKATEMSAHCFAQRRPAPPSALHRADPTRPLCVRFLDSTSELIRSPCCSQLTGVSIFFIPRTRRLPILSKPEGNHKAYLAKPLHANLAPEFISENLANRRPQTCRLGDALGSAASRGQQDTDGSIGHQIN